MAFVQSAMGLDEIDARVTCFRIHASVRVFLYGMEWFGCQLHTEW